MCHHTVQPTFFAAMRLVCDNGTKWFGKETAGRPELIFE
jgi:hypothetical protein